MAGSRAAVARGATEIYLANVIILVANTLYFLILTNVIHSTIGVGVVTALNLMIWLLVTISLLAQPVTSQSPVPAPPAVLKFVPEFLIRKARAAASRAVSVSFLICTAIALVIGGALITFPGIALPFLGGSSVEVIFVQLAGVDVVVLSLVQVSLASVMSSGNMRSAGIYMILWSVLRYGFASILLLRYDIVGVLVGWIMGDMLLFVIALRKAFVFLDRKNGRSTFSLDDFMRYSSYTLLSALLGYVINQADKLFTLASRGLSELAVYNVAIVAASFAGMAPYALTMVLLPTLSTLYASKRHKEMRRLVRQYSRYVPLIVVPIAVGFAATTEVALRIFGSVYVAGFIPSIIVSLTAGVTAVGAVYAAVLLAIGRLRWYLAANVMGVISLAVVAYLVTPTLGLLGPALGRAGLMTVATLIYALAVMRSGFFQFDARAFLCSGLSAVPMGIVVFLSLSLFHTFLRQLAMVPVAAVVGVIIYLGMLRACRSLNAEDFEFIQEMAPVRSQKVIRLIARIGGFATNS